MKIKYLILFLLSIAATHVTLGQWVETFADSTRQLTVTQIKDLYAQGRFAPLPGNRLVQNYTTANHWLHLRLPPGSRRLQYLELENPRLDQVNFYQMFGDSLIDQVVTGDSLPFGSRRFAHYQWVFPVLPDAAQPTDIFVRVAKYGEVLNTSVRLWEPSTFENYGRTRYLLWGILAGMTLLILLLNGMVWLATADVLYGWFMAIVVVSAFHLGAASGLFFQYLWPNIPIINDWFPQTLSAWLIVLFQVHFMQKFIGQTAQNSRIFRFVNVFKYFIIAATVLTISLLLLRAVPAFYFRILLILTLFFSLMVVPLSILSLRERLRQREPVILFYMGITTVQFLTLGLFFVILALSRIGRPLFAFTNEGLVLVNYLVDLILLAPGVLYFGFKRYRQQNEQLLTTLHQQEQAQSERVIEALEMERSRMAEDLYDDVGAMLSTAIGYVSSVQRKPEVREKFPLLTEARRLLDRAVENLRTVSHNLMPKNFAELGLAQSLAETIDKVQAATDIRFQYLVVGNERRLDTGTEVQIFRIAAELINDMHEKLPRLGSHPAVRIIMLTMYSDRKFVDDCKRLGVPGYILKNSGVDEVLNAIETVLAGQRYYDPKLTKSTNPDQHADDSFQRLFQLTKREIEIIGLIGQSFTNEEIANRLFLSVATVKTHRNNINLKLGIKQPADLVRFAIEHGLA